VNGHDFSGTEAEVVAEIRASLMPLSEEAPAHWIR
jgi:hypothetical protein